MKFKKKVALKSKKKKFLNKMLGENHKLYLIKY